MAQSWPNHEKSWPNHGPIMAKSCDRSVSVCFVFFCFAHNKPQNNKPTTTTNQPQQQQNNTPTQTYHMIGP
jgi:hypothetical protein